MTFLRLLRVRQWVKNLFVFVPLLFSGNILNGPLLLKALAAFAVFCLAASSIYILNDIIDRDADRRHPVKSRRPIAAGRVPVAAAAVLSVALAAACFGLIALAFDPYDPVATVVKIYFFLNISYTMGLKRVGIVDVMIIAAGFVLRVICGGVACGIWVSPWLVMMVFLLTLLIAFGKRRDDLLLAARGVEARKSVTGYNLTFINQILSLLAATVVITYICYTLSAEVQERFGTEYIYLTAVFVIAAVIRYLQIAYVRQDSGDPTRTACRDRFIQACCILWLASFLIIIYL